MVKVERFTIAESNGVYDLMHSDPIWKLTLETLVGLITGQYSADGFVMDMVGRSLKGGEYDDIQDPAFRQDVALRDALHILAIYRLYGELFEGQVPKEDIFLAAYKERDIEGTVKKNSIDLDLNIGPKAMFGFITDAHKVVIELQHQGALSQQYVEEVA